MARLKGPPPDAITVWPRRSLPNSGLTRSAHDFGGSVTSAELYVIVQALPERVHRRSAARAAALYSAALRGAEGGNSSNMARACPRSEMLTTSATIPLAAAPVLM